MKLNTATRHFLTILGADLTKIDSNAWQLETAGKLAKHASFGETRRITRQLASGGFITSEDKAAIRTVKVGKSGLRSVPIIVTTISLTDSGKAVYNEVAEALGAQLLAA